MTRSRFQVWLMAAMLALVTVALYWPLTGYDFVNLDDPDYVTANPHVQGGLNWEGVKWAWLNPVCCNWHPLTVWSHMLDCQVFGLNPGGHHLTNVLLHALNVALVFALLQRMTGATWRSLLVAVLFAVHPLRVESVAWVAERKDVLSAFFGLLALIAYARYTGVLSLKSKVQSQEAERIKQKAESRKQKSEAKRPESEVEGPWSVVRGPWSLPHLPSSIFYLLSLFFFALGLMSKPMLVTLPFVLLLLDYWPLGRLARAFHPQVAADVSRRILTADNIAPTDVGGYTVSANRAGYATSGSALSTKTLISTLNSQLSTIPPLLLEKLPFFALSAISSVVTFIVQKHGGAVEAIEKLPLGARSGNALISYCRYLGKLFWPADLAVFYPHPGYWPLEKVLPAGIIILGISVSFIRQWRRSPFLLVGWLWFVGMLVPAIGLVQVGSHAMADRYTYLPSLGVLVLAIWGACGLTRGWRYQALALSVAGGAATVLCLALTRQQLGDWKSSEPLFRHALAVTEHNRLAHINLGVALVTKGQIDEAISQFHEAIRLKPNGADGHNNLGVALARKGQNDQAVSQYQEAIRLRPAYAEAWYNLGNALLMQGQIDEAIRHFQEAIRLNAEYAEAHNNLGIARLAKGQTVEAISQCQQAIRLKPAYPEACYNLGNAFVMQGQTAQAINQYQRAIRLKPDYAVAYYNLGNALLTEGQIDDAIGQYQQAIRLRPSYAEALGAMAGTLGGQGKYAEAIRFYQAALKVQPDQAGVLNNLAWLLASCPDPAFRNGPEAVRLATRACELTGYAQPLLIGTLAAAQAEAGDFQAAIATAERAAALASTLHLEQVAAKNRELLQLYRQGQPFHEKQEKTTDGHR